MTSREPQHRARRVLKTLPAATALASTALLAAACGSAAPAATSGSPGTTLASTSTSTATAGAGDSARETAESRLEAIGTQLGTVLADYRAGKTQQAYTLAKSVSSSLYEGTTEGFCSRLDLADDRQVDSLLAATLPAAIQGHEAASQIAAPTTRAQALAAGCLNAIHRSE